MTTDSTVSAGEVATIKRAAGAGAGAIRFERTPGVLRPLVSAGDAIYGSRYRCSLGFNVVKGGTYYFLTAGHCGKSEKNWYTSASRTTLIGPTTGSSFPGNDYALVRYDNLSLSHPGGFSVADAYVGERVTRDGSTTGVHSGTVTGLNATVRYQGGGTVSGLIEDQRLRRARGLGRARSMTARGLWGSRPAVAATAGREGRPTSSPCARP